MSTRKVTLVVLAIILAICLVIAVSYIFGWIGGAVEVAQDEFGAQAALDKYEWFIDQKAAIEKSEANIKTFQKARDAIEVQYSQTYGEDRTKWLASIKVQYNQTIQTTVDDLRAIVANHNSLVADYNGQSQKFNWSPFQSRDDKPPQIFVAIPVY